MTRKFFIAAVACVAMGWSGAAPAADFTFGVDPATTWQGYMNVFELPANGGAFAFGSGWGAVDLTAVFNGPVLTLGPNTIGDASAYWYTPAGGPGAAGNKIMDANYYKEFPAGTHNGDRITFTGVVSSNTLTTAHVATAFIRDFEPNYSSFVSASAPLTPGVFSITLDTIADPLRHVQYGFNVNGVNVWVTDVGPFGNVKVTAPAGIPGDFDHDGLVNTVDLGLWKTAYGATAAGDANNDGVSNGADFLIWQNNRSAGAAGAVPEPTTALLAAGSLGLMIAVRRRKPA